MDVVRRVRRAAGGAKTGHAGTLDPLATGVVVCCLGRATKSVPRLMALTKVYDAKIDLSAFTNTDDLEGIREEIMVALEPERVVLAEALQSFVGLIEQKPPAHSAVHVDGQRAYRRARRGEMFEMPLRKVRVDAVELLEYRWPMTSVRVTCGKGTYIRSIARDLGRRLGVGGHLAALRRTAVGPYGLATAVDERCLERSIAQGDLLDVPGE